MQLFPSGRIVSAAHPAPSVMRYEDAAGDESIVPVTRPRRRARRAKAVAAAASAEDQSVAKDSAGKAPSGRVAAGDTKNPAAGVAKSANEVELKIERLPPVNRTAAPPLLQPGTKLPQKPIEIYPETGR
jgi:hypothetical protein